MVIESGLDQVYGGKWHLEINDFFYDIPEVRDKVLSRSTKRVIPKNEVIFFEDDLSHSCYYLDKGIVKIFRISISGKEPIFFIRHQGELFGLAEVVDDQKRKCNAQTLTECILYSLPKNRFEELVKTTPEFALKVISVLGARVRYLGEQMESLMICDVSTRLAKLLVYLVFNQLTDLESWEQPVEIAKKLTQEQMASMTGSCQQTISDTLKAFQEEGLIELNRRKITLVNPLVLLRKAEH